MSELFFIIAQIRTIGTTNTLRWGRGLRRSTLLQAAVLLPVVELAGRAGRRRSLSTTKAVSTARVARRKWVRGFGNAECDGGKEKDRGEDLHYERLAERVMRELKRGGESDLA